MKKDKVPADAPYPTFFLRPKPWPLLQSENPLLLPLEMVKGTEQQPAHPHGSLALTKIRVSGYATFI